MAKTVLIVEDDRNIADLLRLYLEKEGYTVVIAPDGMRGVEQFRTVHPSLVLLDVMLPGLDGWGVCRTIRAESQTPIIMLTAKSRRGAEQHEGDIHGVQPRSADAAVVHLLCQRAERGRVLLLDAERFRRLCAGDALVERAGDARVLLAHPAVEKDELLLEIRARDDEDRHDHHHDQRHQRRPDLYGYGYRP